MEFRGDNSIPSNLKEETITDRNIDHNRYMDVSKHRGGPPKWMVKIMENPIKMDDLGVPLFLETPIYNIYILHIIILYIPT